MDLSIIITSFQRPHLLKWGLLSLSRQNMEGYKYEILVINDGLEDGTKEVCEQFPQLPIRYIFSGQRNFDGLKWRVAGFAINIGIKQAIGKNIILTCAEIYHLDNDTTQKIVNRLYENPNNIVITDGLDDQQKTFLKEVEFTNGNPTKFIYRHGDLCEDLSTNLPFYMGINKEEVLQIGGYDEEMTGYAYDDADFVDRLVASGMKIVKLNDKRIIHLYHPRMAARPGIDDIIKEFNFNKAMYDNKKGTVVRNVGREWGKL